MTKKKAEYVTVKLPIRGSDGKIVKYIEQQIPKSMVRGGRFDDTQI